jgi:hypothetical protein
MNPRSGAGGRAVASGRELRQGCRSSRNAADAARADLWASSLWQVDTRLSARTQNPRHQVG